MSTASPDSRPRRRPLAALGRASARHPFVVLAIWLVVLGAAGAFALGGVGGQTLFQRLAEGIPKVDGESQHGQDLLSGRQGTTTLTLLVHGVDVDSPRLGSIATGLGHDLAAVPHTRYTDPLAVPRLPDGSRAPQLAPLLSADGRGVLLTATLSDHPSDARQARVQRILEHARDDVRAAFPRATAEVGGGGLLATSLQGISENDLRRGETVALPIALLVMLFVFGGFLAAGLPLVGAGASIVGALGALFAFTYTMDIANTVINVVTAVGLGLSIDYGLLMVSRFRETYRGATGARGSDRRAARIEAIAETVDRAGRTVAFSGTTFAIASLGLLVFEPVMVRAIGVAAVAVTVIAIASALTLMPAMLSLSGERLIRPGALSRVPGIRGVVSRFGDVAPEDGFFSKLTRRVQRRPELVTLATIVVLLAVGSPLLTLHLANTSVDAIPRASTQYAFQTTLDDEFPDAGLTRVELVTRTRADAVSWAADVERLAHVRSVAEPAESGDGWGALVRLDRSRDGIAVVQEIRAHPPAFAHWVTGVDASTQDLTDSLLRGAPWAALVIAIGTIVLLFLMTGSLVVPLKALVASALSLGASVGVLVWGFELGNFAPVLGFDASHVYGVDVLVLLLTFVFGFGLAMDYEMFILSRIKERVDAGVDGAEAIALGLQRSGRIITSAALIIIVVFLGFATGDLMVIKQLGVGLAVAVLIDATLVRCLLVPAFMTWQRRIMWWAPAPLTRLHARFGLAD
ncbi:MMPL family transporter [Pseudolysinimonas sp.]|uniref:MMPL family transporter n=1 Tax=Pseudolysinimonas sp. TaxID=2680009 RepID=UPI003F7FE2E0